MANQEQLERLRDGGVKAWNRWRAENWEAEIDLSGANLRNANLNSADLRDADLISANLRYANLSEADLSNADLISADLSNADLISADLSNVNLRYANLRYANLSNTNLDASVFYDTILAKVNLSNAIGLDKIKHKGPSELGLNALQLSQGQLPDIFLKGCGLSPWEILAAKLHNPKLTPNQITDIIYDMDRLRNEAPLQVHNLFISYSHGDARFVDRIGELFDAKDVRYWRDMKDATAGPLDQIVVRAMRQNPTVLLVFSQHSVNSDWVEFELQKARELEKEMGRYVICPVALDDSWRTAKWSPILLNQIKKYHILDFSRWEDAAFLEAQFTKLLNGLHLFYKEDRKEK